eukprot:7916276-Prorocentrum_lima.AAC.1
MRGPMVLTSGGACSASAKAIAISSWGATGWAAAGGLSTMAEGSENMAPLGNRAFRNSTNIACASVSLTRPFLVAPHQDRMSGGSLSGHD